MPKARPTPAPAPAPPESSPKTSPGPAPRRAAPPKPPLGTPPKARPTPLAEAAGERLPDAVPFYARTPEARRLRAIVLRVVDEFGAHRICPRVACQRRHRCADRDLRVLPLCFHQHRPLLRFLVLGACARRNISGRAPEPDEDDRPLPSRWHGPSLLDGLAADGLDVAALARPADAGPVDWGFERDAEASAAMAAWRAEGRALGRAAEQAAGRAPSRGAGKGAATGNGAGQGAKKGAEKEGVNAAGPKTRPRSGPAG